MAEQVHAVLAVCGVNAPAARNAIIAEGFDDVSRFGRVTAADMVTMVKALRQLPNNPVRITTLALKNLKALVWWARDRKRRNLPIDSDEFDDDLLDDCITKMELNEVEKDSKIEAPASLTKSEDWIKWELAMVNYLMGMKGASGIPLAYIVRKEVEEDYEFENEVEELIHQAPLEGVVFQTDNKKVYEILKSKLVGTDNYEWVVKYNRSMNGREAMAALRRHFDGLGEKKKRINQAEASLASLHYKSEQAFPFEKYITKLNAAFQILEDFKEGYSERKKVQMMCDKINNNNMDVRAAIQVVLRNEQLSSNFKDAANTLSEAISSISPTIDRPTYDRSKRKISGVDSERGSGRFGRGRGGRFGRNGGRSRGGRYGRGGGRGSNTCNGVDISDVNKDFSPEEWGRLPAVIRNYIRETRSRKKSRAQDDPQPQARGVHAANVTQDEPAESVDERPQGGRGRNAGRGFGRNAYGNRDAGQQS